LKQLNTTVKTAILLAAGRGSRLSPYTDTTPKPLLPYKGKPTLLHIIESLDTAGVVQLLIVTNYLEHKISEFIQQTALPNHIHIKTVTQKTLSGTADAVITAIDLIPSWFTNSFLVSATDYIVEAPFYHELLNYHISHNCGISVSLKKVPPETQSMRSSVRISADMSVSEVIEKPAPGREPSPFTANLVYVLPHSITPFLKDTTPSIRGELELQSAINEWLKSEGCARGLLQQTPQEWNVGMMDKI